MRSTEMKEQVVQLDQERLLEIGFIMLSAGVLTGLGLLAAGRLVGSRQRHRRHSEAAPRPGVIARDRHQQLSTSAR